jgi:hypothetical protein
MKMTGMCFLRMVAGYGKKKDRKRSEDSGERRGSIDINTIKIYEQK